MKGKNKLKKYGWTMTELGIAFIVLIMLSGFAISLFKPNMNKNKLFVYAAIRSFEKANIAIMEKRPEDDLGYSENEELRMDLLSDETTDWYCAQIADVMNTESTPNCTRSAAITDVNLKFSNGITIQGLASAWEKPYTEAAYQLKNIVVDIDGPDNGPNKPGADRFPVRIYRGFGVNNGLIMPVNCANDQVYNTSTEQLVDVQSDAQSPYCKTGKTYTGANSSRNFTIDDEIITYDIHRIKSDEEVARTELIASGLSALEADCAAYGGLGGFFSQLECANAGIKTNIKCATTENCENCANNSGTCPLDASGNPTTAETCETTIRQTNNPRNFSCIAVLHKPSGGMPFFLQAIIGDIGEDGI